MWSRILKLLILDRAIEASAYLRKVIRIGLGRVAPLLNLSSMRHSLIE